MQKAYRTNTRERTSGAESTIKTTHFPRRPYSKLIFSMFYK